MLFCRDDGVAAATAPHEPEPVMPFLKPFSGCDGCRTRKTCRAHARCWDRGFHAKRCNTPGCEVRGATHWNARTSAYYCRACANRLNAAGNGRICTIDSTGMLGIMSAEAQSAAATVRAILQGVLAE